MTPNNPEQSDCCKAPITSGGDARTSFYVCTECQRACDVYVPYESVRRLPEQTEPDPTQKPKWLDDHACAFNDGNCTCECFKKAYEDAVQECYLQCLAVECGEGECAEAIRTKFPDLVTKYEI